MTATPEWLVKAQDDHRPRVNPRTGVLECQCGAADLGPEPYQAANHRADMGIVEKFSYDDEEALTHPNGGGKE